MIYRILSAAFCVAAIALLTACATTPAPVIDRSIGGNAPATHASSAQARSTANGARGEHANGVQTAQGYRVAPGDTLYSIAFTRGLDFRALAARNSIAPPYTIHPGQVLRLDNGDANRVATTTTITTQQAIVPRTSTTTTGTTHQQTPVFGQVEEAPPSGNAPIGHLPIAANQTPAAANPPLTSANLQQIVAAPPLSSVAAGRTRNIDGINWQWPADGAVISGYQADSGAGAGLDIAGKAGDPVRAAADGTVVYSGNGLIGYGELIIIKHSDNYLSAYGHNRKRLVKEGERVRAGQQIAEMGSSGAAREELHFEIRQAGKPVDPTQYLPGR